MKEVRCELRTYVTGLVGRGKELLGQSLEKQAQKPWSGGPGESQENARARHDCIFNIQCWLRGCDTLTYDHLKKIFLVLFRHTRKQEGRQIVQWVRIEVLGQRKEKEVLGQTLSTSAAWTFRAK